MPGHVVKKKPGEEDPDPTPFLVVSLEMKREDQQKPYDPKKSYWCPNGLKEDKAGFMECMLEADDGTKAVVMCGHEVNIQGTVGQHSALRKRVWHKFPEINYIFLPNWVLIDTSFCPTVNKCFDFKPFSSLTSGFL